MVPEPYRLEPLRYFQAVSPDVLESLLFLESDVDVACYHMVPAFGFLHDMSPMTVGLELKRRYPHRIFNYGGVSPLQGQRALDELDRQVEEWGISGLKLYPVDVIDGEMRVLRFDDKDVLYPVLERCRKHGVKVVAVHKAMPLGAVADGPLQERRRRLRGDRLPRPLFRGRAFGVRLPRRGRLPDRPLPERLCRASNRPRRSPSAIRESSPASSASS